MQIPTPISGEVSLYVHLPFCEKKCDYCHFFVLPNQKRYKDTLLEALLLEIEQSKFLLKDKKIISLYFGGGTPALVGPQFIEALLKQFSKFISLENAEITLELNPENHDLTFLKNYQKVGINRLSIGVQTFDDTLLKRLGRTHSSSDAKKAIDNAQLAKLDNVSIDLMYELPTQTVDQWNDTLQEVSQLPLTHLSLYNLSIEPHTVFYKYREKLKKQMPRPAEALKMYEIAQLNLAMQGWQPYEISAFCKNKAYSKHNVGYWFQRNHLGFGPSAYTLWQGRRHQNVKNLKKYSEALMANKSPEEYFEELSSEAFLRESLCLGLRLDQGISLDYFQMRFGKIPQDLMQTLDKLKVNELLIQKNSTLKLTPKGRLYHDEIASEIILV